LEMKLRILSYNIHGCVGWGGKEDAGAVLEVIRKSDADIVALQEVHDEDDVDRSFLKALGTLGYASVLHGSTMRKQEGHYGNVLMTRQPVLEEDKIDLSYKGREPRGAIRARIGIEGMTVEILTTHLGLGIRERRTQLEILAEALPDWLKESEDVVRIGLGDFNEWIPGGRTRRLLHRLFGHSPRVATFPAVFPLIALDRIYVRPHEALVGIKAFREEPADRASDHLPLLAEVSLPDKL